MLPHELRAALAQNRQLQVHILAALERLQRADAPPVANNAAAAADGARFVDIGAALRAAPDNTDTLARRRVLAKLGLPEAHPAPSPKWSPVELAALRQSVVRRLREVLVQGLLDRYRAAQLASAGSAGAGDGGGGGGGGGTGGTSAGASAGGGGGGGASAAGGGSAADVEASSSSSADGASGGDAAATMRELNARIGSVRSMSLEQLEKHLPLLSWEQVGRDVNRVNNSTLLEQQGRQQQQQQHHHQQQTGSTSTTNAASCSSSSALPSLSSSSVNRLGGDAAPLPPSLALRSPTACRLQWIAHETTLVQHSDTWVTAESARLLELVTQHGSAGAWGAIAKELGTRRTALQCLRRWNKVARVAGNGACGVAPAAASAALAAAPAAAPAAAAALAAVAPVAAAAACSSVGRSGKWSAAEDTALRGAVASVEAKRRSAGARRVFGSSSSSSGSGGGGGPERRGSRSDGMWNCIAAQVAETLGGSGGFSSRTAQQCCVRWQDSLDPAIVRGEWTVLQDRALILACRAFLPDDGGDVTAAPATAPAPAVATALEQQQQQQKQKQQHMTKVRWTLIAERVTGRTGAQCRERWVNVLDPRRTFVKWTEREDTLLHFALQQQQQQQQQQHGRAAASGGGTSGTSWAKVAAALAPLLVAEGLVPRTDSQCRQRWRVLQQRTAASAAK